jgi:pilus assembly protein CpaE
MQQPETSPSGSRRACIISPDARIFAELAPLLATHLPGVETSQLHVYPSPRELPETLGAGGSHLVFLDVASDEQQAMQLLGEMTRMGPGVQVLALLSANDPELILRGLRGGAVDFLLQPFTVDQVEAALGKLARQPQAELSGKEPAKIIAVMPAKGACGATTIAFNLAYQWKRQGIKRILLADLDPLTGTLSFLLKVKSSYSFLDVLQRAHELDSDLWKAMVTTIGGVDILLAPDLMADGAQDLQDPSPILEYARHLYDVVILDADSVYGPWNLNQIRQANEVVLVTTNELPALQAAQRALSYLDTNRIGRWKVRLVVNRYLRDVGLSREVIGTALHTDVFDSLPSDYDAVQRALMEGKPIQSGTPFGKSLIHLADRLSVGQRKEETKKSSSLGGLFGLFSRPSKT